MQQINSYTDWLNAVKELGAKKLIKEITPNSEYNILYAEIKPNRIVGNWHAQGKVGWFYQPLTIDKSRRKFKDLPF